MPTRSVSTHDQVVATLTFDGVGDTGTTIGETRNVTGFSVTNNVVLNGQPVAIKVTVQEELNKQRTFEAVVQPGETLSSSNIPAGQRPRQYWNQVGPLFMWDGLNITFQIPAPV